MESNSSVKERKFKTTNSNKSSLKDVSLSQIKDREFKLADLKPNVETISSSKNDTIIEDIQLAKTEESIKPAKEKLNEPPSISPQLHDSVPESERDSPPHLIEKETTNEKVDRYLNEMNGINNVDPTIAVRSQIIEHIIEKENTEIPFWQMPHNRFEYPHFSKQLVSIDPGSYHRLGLAVTDSYVNENTEIDGKIPGFENKSKLDEDDLELLNLATSMENISKKICKSANRLAYKKSEEEAKEIITLDFSEKVSVNFFYFKEKNLKITLIYLKKTRLSSNFSDIFSSKCVYFLKNPF